MNIGSSTRLLDQDSLHQLDNKMTIRIMSHGFGGIPFGDPIDSCGQALEPWFESGGGLQNTSSLICNKVERWMPKGVLKDNWKVLESSMMRCLVAPGAGLFPEKCNFQQTPRLFCFMFRGETGSLYPGVVINHATKQVLKNAMIILNSDQSLSLRRDYLDPWGIRVFTFKEDIRRFSADDAARLSTTYGVESDGRANMCGASLHSDQHNQIATLGGIIRLNMKNYGLTVEHLFQHIQPEVAAGDSDYESDSEIELHELGTPDQITVFTSTVPILSLPNTSKDDGLEMLANYKGLHCRHSQIRSESKDWTLVENDRFHSACNEVRVPPALRSTSNHQEFLYPERVSEDAPTTDVLVITRRGIIPAIGMGSSDLDEGANASGSPSWMVQAKTGTFEYGDSGSWVIDLESGDFYGVLISGLPGLGIGYLESARVIFDDISAVWGNSLSTCQAQVSLPSRNHHLLQGPNEGNSTCLSGSYTYDLSHIHKDNGSYRTHDSLASSSLQVNTFSCSKVDGHAPGRIASRKPFVLHQPASEALLDIVVVNSVADPDSHIEEQSLSLIWQELPFSRISVFQDSLMPQVNPGALDELIIDLVDWLATLRRNSHSSENPIVFVANSFGGLIVQHLLLESSRAAEWQVEALLECTMGLYFTDLPQYIPEIESWESLFSNIRGKTDCPTCGARCICTHSPNPYSQIFAPIQQDFKAMIVNRHARGRPRIHITHVITVSCGLDSNNDLSDAILCRFAASRAIVSAPATTPLFSRHCFPSVKQEALSSIPSLDKRASTLTRYFLNDSKTILTLASGFSNKFIVSELLRMTKDAKVNDQECDIGSDEIKATSNIIPLEEARWEELVKRVADFSNLKFASNAGPNVGKRSIICEQLLETQQTSSDNGKTGHRASNDDTKLNDTDVMNYEKYRRQMKLKNLHTRATSWEIEPGANPLHQDPYSRSQAFTDREKDIPATTAESSADHRQKKQEEKIEQVESMNRLISCAKAGIFLWQPIQERVARRARRER